jgi:hypothetical protein
MRAKTLDGGEIDLKQESLDTLARRLQGPMIRLEPSITSNPEPSGTA